MVISCCVPKCKNNSKNKDIKFYRFPVSSHKELQREKWIAAIRQSLKDASWSPKASYKICSCHFIGNNKSDIQLSPSYVPTIFPNCKENVMKSYTNRYNFFMKRKGFELNAKKIPAASHHPVNISTSQSTSSIREENVGVVMHVETQQRIFFDKECQVITLGQLGAAGEKDSTVIINNFNSYREVEIQVDISANSTFLVKCADKKKFKNKKCGTTQTTFEEKSVQVDTVGKVSDKFFCGFASLKHEDQLLYTAGVTFENFNFLLQSFEDSVHGDISKENKLLIFLVKMKTGMDFTAISTFFSIHRTTVAKIFYTSLHLLARATSELIFWPSKDIVQSTMPECFKASYANTRIVIDCTELRISIPKNIDHRVFCYSNYKKGFTCKILVGMSPSGYICFVSKAAGGRKSDSQLTVESGLINLLEEGDEVLADKGFPEVKTILDHSGKKIMVVMPPFLQNKEEFSKEETEQTYSIGKVRIHIERIMQRLRTYSVLEKINHNLFPHIDDIVHMCCVLVNLQPPIISGVCE